MDAAESVVPPRDSGHRAYERHEPGYALAGYHHHIQFAIWQASGLLDRLANISPDPHHNYIVLGEALAKSREKFMSYIEKWHAEMVEVGKHVGILPEVTLVMDQVETSLFSLWDSTQGSQVIRPDSGLAYLDTSTAHAAIRTAWRTRDRLLRLWPHFDPAKERIDQALDSWEKFYELGVELNDKLDEGIGGTLPDSVKRHAAIDGAQEIMRVMEVQWHLAVKHALNEDLAQRMNDACVRVRDAGRACLANSVTMLPGKTWIELWAVHNDAVLALQDLAPLLRRSIVEERQRRASPGREADDKPRRLVISKSAMVAHLDELPHALTPEGCHILVKVIEGRGQYVDRATLKDGLEIARPDRVIDRMPPAIQAVIQAKRGAGGGYRLIPGVVGTIEP
jgi:hypothetical protein